MEESKKFFKDLFEKISPILISPTSSSITLSLSKRFMLFTLLKKTAQKIEDEPHLNFISLLKYYKVLGKFLQGTIYEFHRDRNKAYFKDFFIDKEIYKRIKEDLEYVYKINQNVNLTITKEGIIVYDNYDKRSFNILLLTVHSGIYVPKNIEKKQNLTKEERIKEEDLDSDRLYCNLVLKQSGIWIDNKHSRYYCDVNRHIDRCIYQEDNNNNIKNLWKEELNGSEKNEIYEFYKMFYSMLSKLLDSYNFNIIFDAHTMRDMKNRPDISFGTQYIPKFYLPIVKSMKYKIINLGYSKVGINRPYGGGFILKWLSSIYPNIFIFSMEVNKKLYMYKNRKKVKIKNREKISNDLINIFDIEEEEGFRIKI
jgi:N-formylglutamate amidohydrolase